MPPTPNTSSPSSTAPTLYNGLDLTSILSGAALASHGPTFHAYLLTFLAALALCLLALQSVGGRPDRAVSYLATFSCASCCARRGCASSCCASCCASCCVLRRRDDFVACLRCGQALLLGAVAAPIAVAAVWAGTAGLGFRSGALAWAISSQAGVLYMLVYLGFALRGRQWALRWGRLWRQRRRSDGSVRFVGPVMILLLAAYLLVAPVVVIANSTPPSYFTITWAFMPFSMAASLLEVYMWHGFVVEVDSAGDDGGSTVRGVVASLHAMLRDTEGGANGSVGANGVSNGIVRAAAAVDVAGEEAGWSAHVSEQNRGMAMERSALVKVAISTLWPHGTFKRRTVRLWGGGGCGFVCGFVGLWI